jgi:hypothetical protein
MFTLLRRLLSLWLAMLLAVSLIVYAVAPELLLQSTLIALASGLISAVALVPYLKLIGPPVSQTTSDNQPILSIFLSMAIRVLGTVALFLFCRYQMGLPPRTVALMVCGWYAMLTSVEAFLLARRTNLLTTSRESTPE